MSKHHEKPGSPGDILAHHGVKGMHWGVRKEDLPSSGSGLLGPKSLASTNDTTKAYMAAASAMAAKPISNEQAAANLKANRERFAKKFESSESTTGFKSPTKQPDLGAIASAKEKWNNLTPEEKHKLAIVGVYGALGAGIIGYGIYANRFALPSTTMLDMSGALAGPGEKLGLGTFMARIGKSQASTMATEDFFRPESFARPGFELPSGHTFRRISAAAEKTFGQATYCSASEDDFNRYAVALGINGVKRHAVTFHSTAPIKVPTLTEVLGHVREQMVAERSALGWSTKVSEAEVLKYYKSISHNQWQDPKALSLIGSLKAKGFGAIVDEMDSGVFSDRPLVLFSKDVTPKKAQVLTRKDLVKSLKNLKEISDPPGRKLATNNLRKANKSLWDQVMQQVAVAA